MKNVTILTIAGLIAGSSLFGQCEPDTANCKDTGDPGQICPAILPEAVANSYYDEVVTVIPPSYVPMENDTVYIDYIVIDSITNLPEGISYTVNAERLYADSAYCVQIFGTPVRAGVDTLILYVTPYLFFLETTIPGPQAVDDSSVVMAVVEASGIDPGHFTEFHLLPNKPNPFSEVTTIEFYTPFDDHIELLVYNILGIEVHREMQGVPPGKYSFDFDGHGLAPGTYFYRVNNQDQYYTGKFIKTKR